MSRGLRFLRNRWAGPAGVLALTACVLAGVTVKSSPAPGPTAAPVAPATSSAAPAPTAVTVPPAAPAPRDLPVITYLHVPPGFPADPGQHSVAAVTEGLHPPHQLALYDRPGGRPRAFLPRSIRGVPVTVPIVARAPGWAAVLVPSVNRRIGWLPAHGWTPRPLHDHVVVRVGAHRLEWFRAGVRQMSWTVAVGARRTPTPLGRTFVLGRTGTRGSHYGGVDALVLGAVPEDREAVAPGLQDAHTGIHAWHNPSVFGRSVSNGCVRMPKAAQELLLASLTPGTPVTVLP